MVQTLAALLRAKYHIIESTQQLQVTGLHTVEGEPYRLLAQKMKDTSRLYSRSFLRTGELRVLYHLYHMIRRCPSTEPYHSRT